MICNFELIFSNEFSKSVKHIEIEIDKNQKYIAGDHLGVIPHNPPHIIKN